MSRCKARWTLRICSRTVMLISDLSLRAHSWDRRVILIRIFDIWSQTRKMQIRPAKWVETFKFKILSTREEWRCCQDSREAHSSPEKTSGSQPRMMSAWATLMRCQWPQLMRSSPVTPPKGVLDSLLWRIRELMWALYTIDCSRIQGPMLTTWFHR